jgi:hypothetical protein
MIWRDRRCCCVTPLFITGRKIAMPRAQYFVTKRNGAVAPAAHRLTAVRKIEPGKISNSELR